MSRKSWIVTGAEPPHTCKKLLATMEPSLKFLIEWFSPAFARTGIGCPRDGKCTAD